MKRMKQFSGPLIGLITIGLFYVETLVVSMTMFIVQIFVRLTPSAMPGHKKLEIFMNEFPRYWGSLGGWLMLKMTGTKLVVHGRSGLTRKTSYLLLPNHQSWGDILIIHYALDAFVSPLRFFMKRQLLWVPVIGLVCKSLGYPFMHRYTKEQIAKNPKLKGKDLKETQKACQRFKNMPVSIISFTEGTRYTEAKAKRQGSPFKHLLKPKAGGIAFTLFAMSDQIDKILHVTIAYSDFRSPTFWQLCCGKVKKVIIDVHAEPIPGDIVGDYANDRDFRVHFQHWLNDTWHKKDGKFEELLREVNA